MLLMLAMNFFNWTSRLDFVRLILQRKWLVARALTPASRPVYSESLFLTEPSDDATA